MEEIIVNKVLNSGLITLDLEDYRPHHETIVYDLKQNLFMDLILREKDFREFIKTHDWTQYSNKNVAILCSEDVLIPTWAYMLLATKLRPYAHKIFYGSKPQMEEAAFLENIEVIDIEAFKNTKVVVKGCSKGEIPASIYVKITEKLLPHVQSLMFGEPCSTVPVFKRPKENLLA
jgi:hypothetical protein